MTDERYNGWRNYETWCVKLWIDNEYAWHCEVRQLARLHAGDNYDLAQAIREMIEDAAPDLKASPFSDLLTSALGAVDWYEIADSVAEETTEEDTYESARRPT